MGVRSLGYLRLEATDLAAWEVFAGDFLGLMRVDGADPELALLPDGRLPAPARRRAGRRRGDHGDRLRGARPPRARPAGRRRRGRGDRGRAGTADECARTAASPGSSGSTTPAATGSSCSTARSSTTSPVQTPAVSGFVTGDMGMGHVIVSAEDGDATVDFYIDVLGFVERNTMGKTVFHGLQPAPPHLRRRPPARARAGCSTSWSRSPRSTTSASALDRADALGVPMMNTLGKHTNDHMVSFYVYSPERYAVEVGWNGLRVDGDAPDLRDHRRARSGVTSSPRRRHDAPAHDAPRPASSRRAASGVPVRSDHRPAARWDDRRRLPRAAARARATVRAGHRQVGRKIGLTSPAVQRQMGVDTPDFGVLFAEMAYRRRRAGPDTAADAATRRGRDRVRARTRPARSARDRQRRAAGDRLRRRRDRDRRQPDPGLGDLDRRHRRRQRIVGDVRPRRLAAPRSPTSTISATCAMSLTRDGARSAAGAGAACLGHPVNAVVWLANAVAERGAPLRAGEVILSGALGPLVAGRARRHVRRHDRRPRLGPRGVRERGSDHGVPPRQPRRRPRLGADEQRAAGQPGVLLARRAAAVGGAGRLRRDLRRRDVDGEQADLGADLQPQPAARAAALRRAAPPPQPRRDDLRLRRPLRHPVRRRRREPAGRARASSSSAGPAPRTR